MFDLGRSARFANAWISHYVDTIDELEGTQFAAVTVDLSDGSTYVAFRGTDNTILGWQEDFTMSFQVMPAQRLAAEYLRERTEATTGPVRVGGHSKGGNLAEFAALALPAAQRACVVQVYSNDGPGLSPQVRAAAAEPWPSEHVERIGPEFGVIGRLFDRGTTTRVVASTARGLLQHDLLTWRVEGTDLVELPAPSPRAQLINQAFDNWLEAADEKERRAFTTAFFGALREGGAELITDVSSSEFGSYESVVFALARSSGQLRRSTWLGIRAAVRALRTIDVRSAVKEAAVLRSVISTIVGALLVIVPDLAIQVLGSLALFLGVVFGSVRIGTYLWRFRRRHHVGWPRVALWILALAGTIALLTQVSILITPTNLLFAVALLVNAWFTAERADRARRGRRRRSLAMWLLTASAVISLLLGVVALSTAGRVLPLFVLQVGQYLLIAGLAELFITAHQRASEPLLQTIDTSWMGRTPDHP